jgi:mRNA interferase RelE/StbE
MKVIFSKNFKKDLLKINDNKIKAQVKSVIIKIETVKDLNQLTNIKKLKGSISAYRIRIGDYRLGFYFDNETVEIARFIKRNDIYKVFS